METQGFENGDELRQHYAAMLGLQRPWVVGRVDFHLVEKRLEIHLEEQRAASGFRNFANYRARILFFLGTLNLAPSPSH